MAYLGILWIVKHGKGLKNKGIYYTITESDEEDGIRYDTSDSLRAANKIVLQRDKHSEEDRLVEWMKSSQPTEDSGSLAERERKAYYKELDRMQGIDLEEDEALAAIESIPDSTQRLILRNYYDMLDADTSSPLEQMMKSSFAPDEKEDWASLYSW